MSSQPERQARAFALPVDLIMERRIRRELAEAEVRGVTAPWYHGYNALLRLLDAARADIEDMGRAAAGLSADVTAFGQRLDDMRAALVELLGACGEHDGSMENCERCAAVRRAAALVTRKENGDAE